MDKPCKWGGMVNVTDSKKESCGKPRHCLVNTAWSLHLTYLHCLWITLPVPLCLTAESQGNFPTSVVRATTNSFFPTSFFFVCVCVLYIFVFFTFYTHILFFMVHTYSVMCTLGQTADRKQWNFPLFNFNSKLCHFL